MKAAAGLYRLFWIETREHGNDFGTATNLNVGTIEYGAIDIPGDKDYFKFTVNQAAVYVIYTRGTMDTSGFLYDSNYAYITNDSGSGELNNFRIVRTLNPGTYYIEVSKYSNGTGNYELHIEGPGAGTVSDDHGFSCWSATPVNVGSITNGAIDIPGDKDYFKFTVNQAAVYVIYTRGTMDTSGFLYDSNYAYITNDSGSGELNNFRIVRTLNPGTYYIEVSKYSNGTGNYELHIEGPGAGTDRDDAG